MDHVMIEEENVVERYLMGQLPATEAARFEEHYLDCQQCLDQLELSKRLHQGLKTVASEEGTRLARTAFLAWLLRRGRPLQLTLTLAVLAVGILPWVKLSRLNSENERLAGEMAAALSPQVRDSAYSLSPERSAPDAEPSTRITPGSAPEWVVLTLELPPFATPARYRLVLRKASVDEPLWQSGPLDHDASGRLSFSVHSSWLEAGDHVVELDALTPNGASESVARFAFRVQH